MRDLEILRFDVLHAPQPHVPEHHHDGGVRVGAAGKVLLEKEQLLEQLLVGVVKPVWRQQHVTLRQERQRPAAQPDSRLRAGRQAGTQAGRQAGSQSVSQSVPLKYFFRSFLGKLETLKALHAALFWCADSLVLVY